MTKKKAADEKGRKSSRVEFLAPEAWVERMTEIAESLGLSLAAYIRLSCEKEARRLEGRPDGD